MKGIGLLSADIVDATYLIINNAKLHMLLDLGLKKIKDLIQLTFDYFELDWEKYVEVDESLLRINDPVSITSDPTLLKSELKWNPKFTFEDLIKSCIEGMIKNK